MVPSTESSPNVTDYSKYQKSPSDWYNMRNWNKKFAIKNLASNYFWLPTTAKIAGGNLAVYAMTRNLELVSKIFSYVINEKLVEESFSMGIVALKGFTTFNEMCMLIKVPAAGFCLNIFKSIFHTFLTTESRSNSEQAKILLSVLCFNMQTTLKESSYERFSKAAIEFLYGPLVGCDIWDKSDNLKRRTDTSQDIITKGLYTVELCKKMANGIKKCTPTEDIPLNEQFASLIYVIRGIAYQLTGFELNNN
jgi:hypothetical protein